MSLIPNHPNYGRAVPNSIVLMFVRGWQGGTINQIAHELEVTPADIEGADFERMGELMRLAQQKHRAQIHALHNA